MTVKQALLLSDSVFINFREKEVEEKEMREGRKKGRKEGKKKGRKGK